MKQQYQNINPTKLQGELIKNGIIPLIVENDLKDGQYIAENTYITFEDNVDITKVQQIVSAHNPIPEVQPPTDEERLSAVESAITALMGV